MIGAAALGQVDGRGALIQRCVLPLMRNVAAVAVLLCQVLPAGVQGEGWLREAVRVWSLAWGAPWAGHLWYLRCRTQVSVQDWWGLRQAWISLVLFSHF